LTLTLPSVAGEVLTDASDLDAANLTGTLPAIDGSALTGISTTVKQIQYALTSGLNSTSSTSHTSCGLSKAITPTATSSKILIIGHIAEVRKTGDTTPRFVLYKNGSELSTLSVYGMDTGNTSQLGNAGLVFTYVDSPATTSSTTYEIKYAANSSAGTIYLNYAGQRNIILLEYEP